MELRSIVEKATLETHCSEFDGWIGFFTYLQSNYNLLWLVPDLLPYIHLLSLKVSQGKHAWTVQKDSLKICSVSFYSLPV